MPVFKQPQPRKEEKPLDDLLKTFEKTPPSKLKDMPDSERKKLLEISRKRFKELEEKGY